MRVTCDQHGSGREGMAACCRSWWIRAGQPATWKSLARGRSAEPFGTAFPPAW